MRKGKGLATTLTAAFLAADLVGCKTSSDAPAVVHPTLPTTAEQPPASAPSSTQASQQASQAPSPASPDIANVGRVVITRDELLKPLTEAFGFNLLMTLIQRDMAREACREQGITVSQADIDKEWTLTLDQLAKDNPDADKQKLLDQFLSQPKAPGQTSTRTEWGIIMESNACLRKLAEPKARTVITDDALRSAFDERYGNLVRVRHIAVSNLREAMQLQEALGNGADFGDLARKYSRADTAKLGGELPPFSINSSRFPTVFKAAAFALKLGQVSDPVQAEGSYHLIQLEERINNKVVKFDDVKDSLREDLQEQVTVEAIKAIRGRLAQEALAQMKITDPILKGEYERRVAARDGAIKSKEKIREEMDKERAAQAATVPSSQPATSQPVATQPTNPRPATTQPMPTPPKPPTPPTTPSVAPPATPSAVPPVVPLPKATQPAATEPVLPVRAPQAPVPPPPPAPATKPAPAAAPVPVPSREASSAPAPAPAARPAPAPATKP